MRISEPVPWPNIIGSPSSIAAAGSHQDRRNRKAGFAYRGMRRHVAFALGPQGQSDQHECRSS